MQAHVFTPGADAQNTQQSGDAMRIVAKSQAPPDLRQRSSRATDVIQRDIGVEFQARNVVSQNKGKKKFDSTQTKRKPLKQVGGLSMETNLKVR